jgi:hypothetical protein
MRLMNIFFLFPLIAASFILPGNETKSSGYVVVAYAKGDLNKDALQDSVVTLKTTSPDSVFYQLKVFFKQANAGYKLVVSTKKAIAPHQFSTGDTLQSIEISKNQLIITYGLLRGHYENKFRYQNGNFELIGHSDGYSDGRGSIFTNDFNLITGRHIHIQEDYEANKLLYKRDTIIKVRPLPKLQNFVPLDINSPIVDNTGSLF